MVHENILSIEKFLSKLLNNLLVEFSKSSNFFFVPQSRRNEDRLISKYNSDSYSTTVIKDLLAIEKLREPEEMFFKYWLKEFNIADDVEVENYEGVSFGIYLVKDKRKINLVDLGVGTNQILPIILSIVVNSYNSFISDPPPLSHYDAITLIMEEPESNLHPNLQSKLADMFIDASYKFNIQFIIETHSEYLIRKLQYWTAKSVIKPKDIALYYFNDLKKIQKNTSQLQRIFIRDDGSLSQDFGPGFFDEAINLKLDLLRLKNTSKN